MADTHSPAPTKAGPSRAAINFFLDAGLLIAFAALLGVTAVLHFVFPAASRATGWRLWGLDYTAWTRIQAGSIALLTLGVLLHLILHWTWVCGFVASRLSRMLGRPIKVGESARTLYGVCLLVLILTLLLAGVGAATIAIRAPQR